MIFLVDKIDLERIEFTELGKYVAIVERIDKYRLQDLIRGAKRLTISSVFFEGQRKQNLKDLGINTEEFLNTIEGDIDAAECGDGIICIPDDKPPYLVAII